MKYRASCRNNYYSQTCAYTHMHMYSRGLCTARHQSLLLPQWWQPLLLLPSKVKTAAHFPKLTPINTFQKIPQIQRSNRRVSRVPIQLVWIIIYSRNHPSWVTARSHTAQKPISTNEAVANHKYTLFFLTVSICFHTTQWCGCFQHKHTQMPTLKFERGDIDSLLNFWIINDITIWEIVPLFFSS